MDKLKMKIAALQLCSTKNPKENLECALSLAECAFKSGANYIQTPEMTNILTRDKKELLANTQPQDISDFVTPFQKLAKKNQGWVHLGSLAVALENGKAANRSFLISPRGEILATYDKIHLFDVILSENESYLESRTYEGGRRGVCANIGAFTLGMSICYDVRFPQLYRAYAKKGANMLSVPAAFTKTTGEAHWHSLLRARAIENGAYVIAAAQEGEHEDGRKTFGHSIIFSPWGDILSENIKGGCDIVMATLNLEEVETTRQRIASLLHDREFAIECIDHD